MAETFRKKNDWRSRYVLHLGGLVKTSMTLAFSSEYIILAVHHDAYEPSTVRWTQSGMEIDQSGGSVLVANADESKVEKDALTVIARETDGQVRQIGQGIRMAPGHIWAQRLMGVDAALPYLARQDKDLSSGEIDAFESVANTMPILTGLPEAAARALVAWLSFPLSRKGYIHLAMLTPKNRYMDTFDDCNRPKW